MKSEKSAGFLNQEKSKEQVDFSERNSESAKTFDSEVAKQIIFCYITKAWEKTIFVQNFIFSQILPRKTFIYSSKVVQSKFFDFC